MGQAETNGDRWERGLRWGLIAIALVLFVVMPDKVIGLVSALARVLVAAFVLKLAWDHGPEVKDLLRAVVKGELSLKVPGLELLRNTERNLDRSLAELPPRHVEQSGATGDEKVDA